METQQIAVITRTDEEHMVESSKYFDDVTSYGLADGVAVLKFADGAEVRIEGAVGFMKRLRME